MIGLTGPRGVGKTTLVLQHIKEKLNLNDSLYVTAEDFYFASHRLLDLADAFVKMGGKYLFIAFVSYAIRILYNMSPFADYFLAEKAQAMPEELCLPGWTANDVQKQQPTISIIN